ncbi:MULTISPECIES: LysR family transcriptional regulator [Hyphomicrobium]|jgi:DNA-binding transcriptional LysR family regulator|uniref:LysR family transcriptional regulator n=1 Tax=Hyphomicrobium TaxID=81 RepID=UPI00036F6EA3|nr:MULTISPECIES: LysR family transcriptional regulator [Hyphomicrobium]WBT36254.1 LysR family transcriptional regulator [Hyphomicrobium sp. DMF-1]HML42772.1 LysR family transcriptional regulator [Hyphomicrobium zavarzinii]
MFIRQMTYLLALAREKHFARAAETCHVTQSTLSAGLKSLERELGMTLVIREPRFMGLTPEGERVAEWAYQILADYESLKQDVGTYREGLKGTLRLGVIPAAMPTVALLTAPFCAKHPGVTVDIQSVSSLAIQSGLEKFELDAGITYLDNEPLANVRKKVLYRERYIFVTNVANPRAKKPAIGWREAVDDNLCLLHEAMQNRRVLNKLAQSLGVELNPTVTANSFLAVCSHVRSGEWSSIIPHTFAYIFAGCEDLALIDLVDPVHSQTIGLVTLDRDPQSPLAHALVKCADGLDLEQMLGGLTPVAV